MKISLNWLREMIDLPSDTAAFCDLLTLAGVEVENIEIRGVANDKIVVAQILESEPHPNADRLSVCKVDDGGGEPRQIVCGAKNYKVGDKIPLAQPGAVLPGNFKIKVGKLRGVESQGMMCSAKELNLAEDADGLLILDASAPVGKPLTVIFPADTILEIEVTPNRPDLLSYFGIAREVSALTGNALKIEPKMVVSEPLANGELIQIDAPEAQERCPFYTARRIRNIKVAPSPDWLRSKLEASGIRAINNIVDITNFVLLELGQPLHAFDASKVRDGIRVRMAVSEEPFFALDGKTYKLKNDDLVISDFVTADNADSRLLAIAGVMGGEESGVTEATTEIILESAYFQPQGIRRTSRRLGLSSDSSYRYERGVNPAGVVAASERAAELIAELAQVGNGEPEPQTFSAGMPPVNQVVVPLRSERVAQILGVAVSETRIAEILSAFGLKKTDDGWKIPCARSDLTREIDLIEEIARVVGIEKIPSRQSGSFSAISETDRAHDRNMCIRHALAAQGFHETRSLTLVSEKAATTPNFVRLKNPLGEDQSILRTSLFPNLIEALEHNIRAGIKAVRIFEIGRIFQKNDAGKIVEIPSLGLLMTGANREVSWRDAEPKLADLFDLKAVLETLGFGEIEFVPFENPQLALSAKIVVSGISRVGGKEIGTVGQSWPAKAREIGVQTPLFVAEIDLSKIANHETLARFQEIAKFPAVTRDIAFFANDEGEKKITHGAIESTLRGGKEPLLESLALFDLFTDASGERVPTGKKSLAYSLTYRAKERTLKADEVNVAHDRLKERLKEKLGVTFRE